MGKRYPSIKNNNVLIQCYGKLKEVFLFNNSRFFTGDFSLFQPLAKFGD